MSGGADVFKEKNGFYQKCSLCYEARRGGGGYNLSDCRDVEVIVRIKRGYLKCEETNVVYGAELGQAVSVVSGKIRGGITSVLLDLGQLIATPVYRQ